MAPSVRRAGRLLAAPALGLATLVGVNVGGVGTAASPCAAVSRPAFRAVGPSRWVCVPEDEGSGYVWALEAGR